eukprot:15400920-Alexandrium_andersonii.AAC.1
MTHHGATPRASAGKAKPFRARLNAASDCLKAPESARTRLRTAARGCLMQLSAERAAEMRFDAAGLGA